MVKVALKMDTKFLFTCSAISAVLRLTEACGKNVVEAPMSSHD